METEYYLNLLKSLIGKTERYLGIDFDTALPIVLSVFTEVNKDRRVQEMIRRKQLITAKQLVFLQKRFGITVEPEITKQEASKLIEEQLGNGNNNSNNYRNSTSRLATARSY